MEEQHRKLILLVAAFGSYHPDAVLPSLNDRDRALQAIVGAQNGLGQTNINR